MSLTEIMSAAGLSRYAEVALVLFIFAFVVIMWRIYRPSKKRAFEQAARLPLEDDAAPRAPGDERPPDAGKRSN